MAVMFGILYGASCITKLWGNFWVLMLGRLLGGISTSLLFSVFESWMVYEHHKVPFPSSRFEEKIAVFDMYVKFQYISKAKKTNGVPVSRHAEFSYLKKGLRFVDLI